VYLPAVKRWLNTRNITTTCRVSPPPSRTTTSKSSGSPSPTRRTPIICAPVLAPSPAALLHEILQWEPHASIPEERCTGLARRRSRRAHSLSPNPGADCITNMAGFNLRQAQPDHSVSLCDSSASSTRIRFSEHTTGNGSEAPGGLLIDAETFREGPSWSPPYCEAHRPLPERRSRVSRYAIPRTLK
jgi:hypothetical protein